jgi:hypothetical protein
MGNPVFFRYLMGLDVRCRGCLPPKGRELGDLGAGHPCRLYLRGLDDSVGAQLYNRNVPLGLCGGTDWDSRKRCGTGGDGQLHDRGDFGSSLCSQ